MSHAPRSPTPSRSPAPALSRATPSRIAVPVLQSQPSFSNLNPNQNPSHLSSAPAAGLDSYASSLSNADSEGIILQDEDVEDPPEVEEVTVTATLDQQDSKRALREQLRNTLSHSFTSVESSTPRQKGKQPAMADIPHVTAQRYPRRQYFVFSDAGKPVFVSADGPDAERFTTTFGIMQALISVFIDDGDKLRCINAGGTRITFLQRAPLYYACVSSWGEPESVQTRTHLDYLHLQILSIVTAAQLRRIFERRTNFDLRRLLNGAEGFLSSLLERMELDLALSTSSLWCLRLDLGLRKRIAEALIPPSKKEILYVVLMARGRVVTLIRPRKHSVHPADIHILLNTVYAPSILNAPASTSWIPLCLPKFNPSGFVNAYISFLSRPDSPPAIIPVQPSGNPETASQTTSISPPAPSSQVSLHPDQASQEPSRAPTPSSASVDDVSLAEKAPYDDPNVVLVCISGGAEFDVVRGWCDSACERLVTEGSLSSLISACTTDQRTEYSVGELGIPGLRHFIYKARAQVQVTMPAFEDPYEGVDERRRLVTLYQKLHDAIHARSGQGETLKLQYIKTEKESVMGWITQPFELYIALSPLLPKTAVINAANAVTRWIRKEETKLFLRDAPVF
ncbi:DUF254-domain-containing protein [Schizophyllum commune]